MGLSSRRGSSPKISRIETANQLESKDSLDRDELRVRIGRLFDSWLQNNKLKSRSYPAYILRLHTAKQTR